MIYPPDYGWSKRKDLPRIRAMNAQLCQELGLPVKARKARHARPRRKRQQTEYATGDLFDCPREDLQGGRHA